MPLTSALLFNDAGQHCAYPSPSGLTAAITVALHATEHWVSEIDTGVATLALGAVEGPRTKALVAGRQLSSQSPATLALAWEPDINLENLEKARSSFCPSSSVNSALHLLLENCRQAAAFLLAVHDHDASPVQFRQTGGPGLSAQESCGQGLSEPKSAETLHLNHLRFNQFAKRWMALDVSRRPGPFSIFFPAMPSLPPDRIVVVLGLELERLCREAAAGAGCPLTSYVGCCFLLQELYTVYSTLNNLATQLLKLYLCTTALHRKNNDGGDDNVPLFHSRAPIKDCGGSLFGETLVTLTLPSHGRCNLFFYSWHEITAVFAFAVGERGPTTLISTSSAPHHEPSDVLKPMTEKLQANLPKLRRRLATALMLQSKGPLRPHILDFVHAAGVPVVITGWDETQTLVEGKHSSRCSKCNSSGPSVPPPEIFRQWSAQWVSWGERSIAAAVGAAACDQPIASSRATFGQIVRLRSGKWFYVRCASGRCVLTSGKGASALTVDFMDGLRSALKSRLPSHIAIK